MDVDGLSRKKTPSFNKFAGLSAGEAFENVSVCEGVAMAGVATLFARE